MRLCLGNFAVFQRCEARWLRPALHRRGRQDAAEVSPRALRSAGADRLHLGAGAAADGRREHRQDLSLLRQQGRAGGRRCPGSYDKNQALVYHFGPARRMRRRTPRRTRASPPNFPAEVNPASLIGSGPAIQWRARRSPCRPRRAAAAARAGHDDFRLGTHRVAADAGVRRATGRQRARARCSASKARRPSRAYVDGTTPVQVG